MIVLFSSNAKGGIAQFTVKLMETLHEMGKEAITFLPTETRQPDTTQIVLYDRKPTINGFDPTVTGVVEQILRYQPELVLFTDDVLFSAQVLNKIGGRVKTAMCIHDVVAHKYNKWLIYQLKRMLKIPQVNHAYKKADKIILLSQNTLTLFREKHPEHAEKTLFMRLGAHVPSVTSRPVEEIVLAGVKKYVLFFGRIDKYKGIESLLEAYSAVEEEIGADLVIAGKGDFTDAEQVLLKKLRWIHVLNRYVEDSEMLWLFQHAKLIALPYIEASQSGVLPMAYHYGKPVIVSDLPGLTENVLEDRTGFIFRSPEEFQAKLIQGVEQGGEMQEDIEAYYVENYCWETNLSRILDQLLPESEAKDQGRED